MLGVEMGEGALANFADAARRTDSVDDIGVGHGKSPDAIRCRSLEAIYI